MSKAHLGRTGNRPRAKEAFVKMAKVREETNLADTLNGAGGLQSIPALLHRNATQYARSAAYRE